MKDLGPDEGFFHNKECLVFKYLWHEYILLVSFLQLCVTQADIFFYFGYDHSLFGFGFCFFTISSHQE